MLLRFGVANHLSIKEPQALSLAASALRDIESGLIDCPAAPEGRVLPAVVIYGANASGKSNIVAALRFMRGAVLSSHRRGEPGGGVQRAPFALDPICANSPSVFAADFVVQGVRYHYGFEASDEAFTTEWLYAFPSSRRQTLFEREGSKFTFGRSLKGRNRIIADLTRPNSLFVSAAVQNGHEDLAKIGNFFRSVRADSGADIPEELAFLSMRGNVIDNRIIHFLEKIGTGIVDCRRRETEILKGTPDTQEQSADTLHQEILSTIQRELTRIVAQGGGSFTLTENEGKSVTIEFAHRGRTGEPIYLALNRESAGTRRLLILLSRAFQALDKGAPMVIDELDLSLHTQACEAVLALFSSPKANPKGAQLIATTHDTNLLRSPLLRRDQVWFTEKDDQGATHLYPLTDIRTRRGDNIEKGYLQGRYGAIPFSGPLPDPLTAG
jgi:AAA15 family ATPase/GTPase